MRFINNNEVIVAPVQSIQVQTVGSAVFSGKVSVEQDIISQTVIGDRIVNVIIFVCIPVRCQFLRAENKNILVAVFVILHDCKGSKGLTETNCWKSASVLPNCWNDADLKCWSF